MLIPAVFPEKRRPLPTHDATVLPFLQALLGDDGEMITELRTSDGKVNATKMCQTASTRLKKKKKFADFLAVAKVHEFLLALADELGVEVGVDFEKFGGGISLRQKGDGGNHVLQKVDKLIEVISGGKHAGSWIDARVAIRLAEWCSVKFSVQTNGVIYRYMLGEVTTEESRAVAQAIAKSTVSSRPLPITYDDINRFMSEGTTVVPLHCKPPNTGYILILGVLPDGNLLAEWGMSAHFQKRHTQHLVEHPGCKIQMVINVGVHQPKHLEDSMRIYFRDKEQRVEKPSGQGLRECFVVPEEGSFEYFGRFGEFVLENFADSVSVLTFEGKDYKPGDTIVSAPVTRDVTTSTNDPTILLEIEKIKLEQEYEKTAQEQAKVEQERERTAQEEAKVEQERERTAQEEAKAEQEQAKATQAREKTAQQVSTMWS
jgi:hypothetical protein